MSGKVETYFTIRKDSTGLFKDKGSKFFSYAFPVFDLDSITARLAEVKKEHHSARHHCYAYRIENDGAVFRSNDDGEPAHSAGDPILGQIDSHRLTYTLIVVVRYFGGIKLGVGGLINAYREAAKSAIEENEIIEKVVRSRFRIDFSYERMSIVMRILKRHNADMISNEFTISCRLVAEVDVSKESAFLGEWVDLHDVICEALS